MTRLLTAANGLAILLLGPALAVLAVGRNPLALLPAFHVAACGLALLAARAGAGIAMRGWAIGGNVLCLLVDGLLLLALAYGLARGLAAGSGKVAAFAGLLVALAWLCTRNVRATILRNAADA
jgi:hypothetical protein